MVVKMFSIDRHTEDGGAAGCRDGGVPSAAPVVVGWDRGFSLPSSLLPAAGGWALCSARRYLDGGCGRAGGIPSGNLSGTLLLLLCMTMMGLQWLVILQASGADD
jgi:hypothetical protein